MVSTLDSKSDDLNSNFGSSNVVFESIFKKDTL